MRMSECYLNRKKNVEMQLLLSLQKELKHSTNINLYAFFHSFVCVHIQSNLGGSFFTGLEEKNEQNRKNDASGINVFSAKLQKIVMQ